MFRFLKKEKAIHEPLEKQVADNKKLHPHVANIVSNGLSCDKLPNATGEFGSITNPIPVNGPLGEIKYLGKLRGKTGHAVFFHRIGSATSDVTSHPVDIFELVCLDGTQWNKLYFDFYHPRRSNLAPKGYSLMPYNKQIKMDLPFAYGVTSLLANFPYDLPENLDNYYGGTGAYSRHAKKWLDKYSFEKPDDDTMERPLPKQIENRTTKYVENFKLINEVLIKALNVEKYLLINEKDSLMGYSNAKLFDKQYDERFIIERFVFFRAYLEWVEFSSMNTQDVYKYMTEKASNVYGLTDSEACKFIDKRQKLYVLELEMLNTFETPHAGKIMWCLQNPTAEEMNHRIDSSFEKSFIASHIIVNSIITVYKDAIESYNQNAAETEPPIKRNSLDMIRGRAEKLINEGNEYYNKKQFILALEKYKKAYDIRPEEFHCDDFFRFGCSSLDSKNYTLATESLIKASKCETDNKRIFHIYLCLAESYEKQKDYNKANDYLEKSLAIADGDFNKSIVYFRLGDICNELEENHEAIEYYKKSLFIQLKQLSITDDDILKARVKDDKLGETYFILSELNYRVNKLDKGNECIIKAILCGNKVAEKKLTGRY